MGRTIFRALLAGVLVLGATQAVQAQSWRDRLKKAKEKVEKHVPSKPAEQPQEQAAEDPQDGAAAAASAGVTAGDAEAEAPAAFVNYDFVPGDRVIFAEDFGEDNVGDAPRRLEPLSGNVEVAEFLGRRWMRATSFGTVAIPLPEKLPERFTFEAEIIQTWGWSAELHFGAKDRVQEFQVVEFGGNSGVGDFKSRPAVDRSKQPARLRIMADGKYVKVYVDGKRVANAPRVEIGRTNRIWIDFPADDNTPFYIGDIRIAEGGRKLYDAIAAKGRAATHGILFDTGSERIRPESQPTLKEIGAMLTAHPALKLVIEGHTDNVGSAASNQTLSEQRAAAVKAYLVDTLHVDAARLSSKGCGDTKPAASNDTAEGRQTNRRVELVKM
ncbi:MAG TPA: OmpA family protein [Longimicrobiales bacterium]|nr:OmpA family protein [Longimicrobiales bacterium]